MSSEEIKKYDLLKALEVCVVDGGGAGSSSSSSFHPAAASLGTIPLTPSSNGHAESSSTIVTNNITIPPPHKKQKLSHPKPLHEKQRDERVSAARYRFRYLSMAERRLLLLSEFKISPIPSIAHECHPKSCRMMWCPEDDTLFVCIQTGCIHRCVPELCEYSEVSKSSNQAFCVLSGKMVDSDPTDNTDDMFSGRLQWTDVALQSFGIGENIRTHTRLDLKLIESLQETEQASRIISQLLHSPERERQEQQSLSKTYSLCSEQFLAMARRRLSLGKYPIVTFQDFVMIVWNGYQKSIHHQTTRMSISGVLQNSIARLVCFLWKKFTISTFPLSRDLVKHKYRFTSHVIVLVYSLCHGVKDWLPKLPELAACMPSSIDRICVPGFQSRIFSKALSDFTESLCELMKREPESTAHFVRTLFP